MYDKERALRTDTDSNDTVKISPIPICGICIGASLLDLNTIAEQFVTVNERRRHFFGN